ncbi:restriction endonuclease subunit S [Comamonas thiooxydans]|uniref:restriction endonuclease subunit S n=1 Tax=Comamonas thiooxydans TaxID=363952 RepID=UPI0021158277|nr:restriction endonuclease subunit S [Comamonas thiooxydans]UUE95586.1 restriction endonuclease subunit S [Comamonas thiooxydans]
MLNTSNDQRKLLPNFDQLFAATAQAPGGVARLRELILTLAVQGKLVAQNADDEPASELLKKVRTEKDRLIAEGKIKKDKPLAAITEEGNSFELPMGWEVCRLGDIFLSIKSGGTPSKNNPSYWNGEIPWASVKDLKFGEPLEDTQDKITAEGLEAGSQLAVAGSILICTRMGLGKIGEALVDVAINQDLKAVQLGMGFDKNYFINFFKTLNLTGSGMTVAGIKQDELLSLLLPLPPEKEQSRIVARVEELMGLCDALEEKGRLEHTQHQQLLQALLDSLTETQNAQELARHWQRLAQHFDLLIDRPEAVDALEQTILQLAVHGLLVEQDASDEPASELLKKIRAEKDRLIAEGKIKKDKPLPAIGEEEKPFELPRGWEWVRLGDLFEITSSKRIHVKDYVKDGVPFFRSKEIGELSRGVKITTEICISRSQYENLKGMAGFPQENDLMVTSVGSIGNTWLVDAREFYYKDGNITKLRGYCEISMQYLQKFIRSEFFMSQVNDAVSGTAYNALTIVKLNYMQFPLPPLAEQSRIVARVTELRALCQQLRDKLTQARSIVTTYAKRVQAG